MKKISLSSVKEFLTRDEMRAVSGGSGSSCLTWVNCNWNSQCTDPNCSRCVSVSGGGACGSW